MVSESLKRAIKKWNEKNRDKFLDLLNHKRESLIKNLELNSEIFFI
jgi:hypothetical protein